MPRLLLILAVGALVACGKGNHQSADGAAPKPPQGMEIAAHEGTGRVFEKHLSGGSASQMMLQLLKDTAGYFDGPLGISHAMRNQADTHARIGFTGSVHNKPVRGLYYVSAGAGGARGLMTIDYSDRIAQSFKSLLSQSEQVMPGKWQAGVLRSATSPAC